MRGELFSYLLTFTYRQLVPREQQKLFSDILNKHQNLEGKVGKTLSRSSSFGEKTNHNLLTNPAEAKASKYRCVNMFIGNVIIIKLFILACQAIQK